jgi:hypothetical protein
MQTLSFNRIKNPNPRAKLTPPFAIRIAGCRPEGKFDTIEDAVASVNPDHVGGKDQATVMVVAYHGAWIIGEVVKA